MVPLEDESPWEVKLGEVEEAEADTVVVEEVEGDCKVVEGDWKVVEEVAYSWGCLWRSDWMKFDPIDY